MQPYIQNTNTHSFSSLVFIRSLCSSRHVKMDLNTFIIKYRYRKYCHSDGFQIEGSAGYYYESKKYFELFLISTLMCQLRKDETKRFNDFRISIPNFDDLLRRVEMSLIRQNTNMDTHNRTNLI